MKKLIQGIIDFRENALPEYREKFAKLALNQSPDALFIGCSDSRVVPNLFASTNPGDLFVVRNVGNLVPPCDPKGAHLGKNAEGAAIDFAVENLGVKDIIVCGHSNCGAIGAMLAGRNNLLSDHLKHWLENAEESAGPKMESMLSEHPEERNNHVSQLNALLQMKHLETYPSVQKKIQAGKLRLHAWYFDLATADVSAYDAATKAYRLIDHQTKI